MSCCVNAFDHQNLKGHSSNKTPKNIRSRMLCFRCLASCFSICSFLYSVLYMIVCPFLCLSCSVLQFTASDSPFDIIKLSMALHFPLNMQKLWGVLKFCLLSRGMKIEYDVYIMMCLRGDKNG
jgi:hypothetical protein